MEIEFIGDELLRLWNLRVIFDALLPSFNLPWSEKKRRLSAQIEVWYVFDVELTGQLSFRLLPLLGQTL